MQVYLFAVKDVINRMAFFLSKEKQAGSCRKALIIHSSVSSFSQLFSGKRKAVYIIFGKEAEVLTFVRLYYLNTFSLSIRLKMLLTGIGYKRAMQQ